MQRRTWLLHSVLKKGNFSRTGSTSNIIGHEDAEGLTRGRANVHANESKKYQNKSYFCNYYPDENYVQVRKSWKIGNFQDLSIASCLMFEEENKPKIQDLFH